MSKAAETANGLLSVGEVADFLKVSRASIYRWMECGDLPYAQIGGCRRVPKSAVETFVNERMRGEGCVRVGG